MDNKMNKAVNTLPAATFRWLNLNSLQLDTPINNEMLSYTKDYMKSCRTINAQPEIMIEKMKDTLMLPLSLGKAPTEEAAYGVSEELVRLCEVSYNAGIFVAVPKGADVAEPIRLEYALDSSNPKLLDYNIIHAAPKSQVTLVIDYATEDASETFHNGAMKIYAEEGSVVTIIKIQRMNDRSKHFDSNYAYVQNGAKVWFIQVELGAGQSVTNYRSVLKDAGESSIDSFYFGDSDRLIDLNYLMTHIGRGSVSHIRTKGALKDHSVKNFRGTIDFRKGASKSEGSEEEYVLLFDKHVKSNSVPLLLCSEDDVKGQHAASAGKVDSEKLFYMMSRGFKKEDAMKLIVEASFQPIIEQIPFEDLKNTIGEEIKRRLKDENL